MSLGFQAAGHEVVCAVDSDPKHAATYRANFPKTKVVCADIRELSGRCIKGSAGVAGEGVDVVFGGPPCQGFSLMGRRTTADPRNGLLLEFARLVLELRPRYFVLENVEGLMLGEMRTAADSFVAACEAGGYRITKPVIALNASDFGVPQHRRRVFILGYAAREYPPSYPVPDRTKGGTCDSQPTVWDAIRDLAALSHYRNLLTSDVYSGRRRRRNEYAAKLDRLLGRHRIGILRRVTGAPALSGCGLSRHTETTMARFASTSPGSYEPISRFHRLCKNGLSNTIRAGTGSDMGSYTAPRPIHPVEPRCITVREAARLQSFPDWFSFHRTKWHGFRQVGNAVPPLLARAVAASIAAAARQGRT